MFSRTSIGNTTNNTYSLLTNEIEYWKYIVNIRAVSKGRMKYGMLIILED